MPKWHKVIWFISTRMANPKTTTAAQETLASNSTAEQLASFDIISLLSASRTRLTGAQARAANAFIRLAKILSQATSRAQNRQLTSRDTKEIIFTRPERHKERSEKTKHQIGRSKNRNRKKKSRVLRSPEQKKQQRNQIKCQQHGIEGRAKSCRLIGSTFSQVRAADFWLCFPTFSPKSKSCLESWPVLPARMFPQQINTTFDTSLLCPQRNRINSIPGPWLATSGHVMVSKVLGLRSSVLRIRTRRTRRRTTIPAIHCSSLRALRLKAACPVDTFA